MVLVERANVSDVDGADADAEVGVDVDMGVDVDTDAVFEELDWKLGPEFDVTNTCSGTVLEEVMPSYPKAELSCALAIVITSALNTKNSTAKTARFLSIILRILNALIRLIPFVVKTLLLLWVSGDIMMFIFFLVHIVQR